MIFIFIFFWLIALIHLINNVDFQCNKIKEILYFSPYLLFTPAIIFFFSADRANDVKVGALVGVDKYGNKYYEDSKNYFFGKSQKLEFVKITK